jgi:hypothetical protein
MWLERCAPPPLRRAEEHGTTRGTAATLPTAFTRSSGVLGVHRRLCQFPTRCLPGELLQLSHLPHLRAHSWQAGVLSVSVGPWLRGRGETGELNLIPSANQILSSL